MSDLDTKYTKELTCPYCGKAKHDSWDYLFEGEDEREIECGECGETYIAYRDIAVTYCTSKKQTVEVKK